MATAPNTNNPPAHPEQRLAELGLTLPKPATPVAAYVPTKRAGSLLYISGQIPIRDGAVVLQGRVGDTVSIGQAHECARICVLNALAAMKAAVGDLERVKQVVRVGVWVACKDDFVDQPKVANGASELLVSVFGETGRHARAAVGTNALPLGVPVEVEVLVEVE